MGPFETIRKEWGVIRAAPWSAVALVIAGALIGAGAIATLDRHEISDARADRDLAQHELQAEGDLRKATPRVSGPPAATLQEIEQPAPKTHDQTTLAIDSGPRKVHGKTLDTSGPRGDKREIQR